MGDLYEVDENGKLTIQALQVIEGASMGLVLTSDADGNATWEVAPGATSGYYLPLAGGTMTGDLDATGHTVTAGWFVGDGSQLDGAAGGVTSGFTSGYDWQNGATGATFISLDVDWTGGKRILVNGTIQVTGQNVSKGNSSQMEFTVSVFYNGSLINTVSYHNLAQERAPYGSTTDYEIVSVPITAYVPVSIAGTGHPLLIVGTYQDSRRIVSLTWSGMDLTADVIVNALEI